jgi:signal transduction histidine kinase
MAIIAYMASQQAPHLPWLWGTWLGAVVLAQLVRVVIIKRLPGRKHLDARDTLHTAILVNACNIVLHSISLVFFPLFTPFQAALQSMLILGMGVASIVTAMGYLPFALAHIGLGLLPLFIMWAWSGLFGPGGTLGLLVAGVGFAYTVTLYFVSRRIFKLFRESFEMRSLLEEALASAEAAGNAKTRFLAAASHDLRQPIHTLSLFSAALGMRELDEKTQHIADNIDGAVKALASQMDALLDISRLDAGIVQVKPLRFDLCEFLTRLHKELNLTAAEKDIELRVSCPAAAFTRTDPVLLERILRNLLSNAIAHNTGCSIDLVAARGEGGWQVSVADNGCGIPLDDHDKIFEEFYQVSNPERDRGKGLGLGLAIVERLSRLLALELEFQSEPGRGTVFGLRLPVDDARAESGIGSSDVNSLQGLRVLVVDDESQVREGMKVLLELLGCQVQVAASTGDAVSLATAAKPDLALVDFRLREQDSGLATIDSLRKLHPGLPAIIVSGDTAPDRLQQARDAGIPVLSKPVLVEPLQAAISSACDLRE